jgi:hypothetical protein
MRLLLHKQHRRRENREVKLNDCPNGIERQRGGRGDLWY